jgi:hypothetical protein
LPPCSGSACKSLTVVKKAARENNPIILDPVV